MTSAEVISLIGPDPEIESWLREHGVEEFEFRQRILIEDIDRKASLSNQARLEALNQDHVLVLAEALSQGAIFRPCVFYKRPRVRLLKAIDANHRVAASELIDRDAVYGAYVITQELTETQEHLLIATANTRHGLPNTMEERLDIAVWLVEHRHTTQREAARIALVPPDRLSDRLGLIEADKRLHDLVGARVVHRIAPSNRKRLGALKSNVVMAEAAKLASTVTMPAGDVSALVRDLNKLRSEKDQMRFLASLRDDLRAQKAATAGEKVSVPRPLKRLMSALGTLLALDEGEIIEAEADPQLMKQLKERIVQAQHRLSVMAESL